MERSQAEARARETAAAQTDRGRPPPVIGQRFMWTAMWIMFAASCVNVVIT